MESVLALALVVALLTIGWIAATRKHRKESGASNRSPRVTATPLATPTVSEPVGDKVTAPSAEDHRESLAGVIWDSPPVTSTALRPKETAETARKVPPPDNPTPLRVAERRSSAGAPPESSSRVAVGSWYPQGVSANVGRHSIPDGLVYVGSGLPALSASYVAPQPEPALIDPALPVSNTELDLEGVHLSYWPSYSGIPPSSRAAYLKWLNSGRSDPTTNLGYVFLYFYGLERRALHDAKTIPAVQAELPTIVAEVERLRRIYGENRSFNRYSSGLLDILSLSGAQTSWRGVTPPNERRSDGLPSTLRITVGQMAREGIPLPPDWALSWVMSDSLVPLRTPARRCEEEFAALFRLRYRSRHGRGLVLRACQRPICSTYRPASASFGAGVTVELDLPDVSSLVSPRRELQALAEECSEALEGFSRWLARNPSGRTSLAAVAFLPADLVAVNPPDDLAKLRERISGGLVDATSALLPAAEILHSWLPADSTAMSKKAATEAAHVFTQVGFGIEPDCRFGGPRPTRSDTVVVFRLGEGDPDAPSAAYSAASLLLHLSAMVAGSDGTAADEEKHLRDHLSRSLLLTEGEQRRLRAHLQMLLASPPRMDGLKKRAEVLAVSQREEIGRFLAQVACADGVVSPAEVKALTKIYRLLGLNPETVHEVLHAVQAPSGAATGPVRMRDADPTVKGYVIPPPRPTVAAGASSSGGFALDAASIQAKLAETAAVSALLTGIFDQEDQATPVVAETTTLRDSAANVLLGGRATLLRELGSKLAWPREDFEKLAAGLGLLPSGTLEELNELAIERFGSPLAEGTDPIEIDPEIHAQLCHPQTA